MNKDLEQDINFYWPFLQDAARGLGLAVSKEEPHIFWVQRTQEDAVAAMGGVAQRPAHWMFGRLAEIYTQREGAHFEDLMIPGDKVRAFLRRDISLARALLFLAHLLAYNDFARHNIAYASVFHEPVWQKVLVHAERIRRYAGDPLIAHKVADTVNAARALMYHCAHGVLWGEQTDDLLEHTIARSKTLEDWQKDVLSILHEEWRLFLPKLETALTAAGYAAFFQWRILERVAMPFALRKECLDEYAKMLAAPPEGSLNFAQIGSEIFSEIARREGNSGVFHARNTMHDVLLIFQFLTQEIGERCALFSWEAAPGSLGSSKPSIERVVVRAIARDPQSWAIIRRTFAEHVGCAPYRPLRFVRDAAGALQDPYASDMLTLKHVFQGKVLDAHNAEVTLRRMYFLWGIPAEVVIIAQDGRLRYRFDGKKFVLSHY